jgi:sugar phosphate isomerase/epimerase
MWMPRPELMSLYWTTAGMFPGLGEISRFDIRDRVGSAARAGFTGIGLWHTDLEHILATWSLRDLRALLDDHGIRHLELEFLTDWFLTGVRRAASDERRKRLLAASSALGAKHVKVGDFDNSPYEMPRLIDAFGQLCAEAQTHGATIGFEFMGSAMLNTLPAALAMVEGAAAPNGGLIVDIVHAVNLGISYDAIARIPNRYLIGAELNDGLLPRADRQHDAGQRRFCGDGEFDIGGFIGAIRATGYSGPWGVEVFAHALDGLPLDEINRTAFDTTIAQFS